MSETWRFSLRHAFLWTFVAAVFFGILASFGMESLAHALAATLLVLGVWYDRQLTNLTRVIIVAALLFYLLYTVPRVR